MKKPWISAILNFFFMGPGYIYNGKRAAIGAFWTIAAVALTYVELQLMELDMTLYGIMFGAVFVANTCFAIDGYNEAKAINNAKA